MRVRKIVTQSNRTVHLTPHGDGSKVRESGLCKRSIWVEGLRSLKVPESAKVGWGVDEGDHGKKFIPSVIEFQFPQGYFPLEAEVTGNLVDDPLRQVTVTYALDSRSKEESMAPYAIIEVINKVKGIA